MTTPTARTATSAAESAALHERARRFVEAFVRDLDPDPQELDRFACDVARFQASHIPGYARLCLARGVAPSELRSRAEIPPVPAEVFKLTTVATFDAEDAVATFRTSGTTIGSRGTHLMRDTATYDAAALAFGRRWLARDLTERVPVVVLGPAPRRVPDSSLGHMCELFVRELGEAASEGSTWLIDDDDVIDLSAFSERVAIAMMRDQPMLVLATSFALVHLLDALGDDTFHLPQGSRVMQTGGFKGKSREVEPARLRAELARVFDVPPNAIVAEYGMTELSSQFYEPTLFVPDTAHGVFVEPPWAQVIPVDPETLEPMTDGDVGIAKIVDLMNVDSAVAVLTQDRVRRCGTNRFELLGRLPGAPPRGCSIGIDELLGR